MITSVGRWCSAQPDMRQKSAFHLHSILLIRSPIHQEETTASCFFRGPGIFLCFLLCYLTSVERLFLLARTIAASSTQQFAYIACAGGHRAGMKDDHHELPANLCIPRKVHDLQLFAARVAFSNFLRRSLATPTPSAFATSRLAPVKYERMGSSRLLLVGGRSGGRLG